MILLLFSCVPHSYVDILNNTGDSIEIVSYEKTYALAEGDSVEFGHHNFLFNRWEDVDGDGIERGIIQLHAGDKILEYYWTVLPGMEDPLKGYYRRDCIVTWIRMQIEPDYSIWLVKPEDIRPINTQYKQPEGWPLVPINLKK